MKHERTRRSRHQLLECAYHEAGHAIACLVLGFRVVRVHIRREPGVLGACASVQPDGYRVRSYWERRELGRKSIIVSFAGAAARQLIDPLHAHEGCEDDELLVWVTSSVYGVMPRMKNGYDDDHYMHYLDKLRMEAARLIKRHHAAVSLLAHELLLRRSISGRLLLRWAANNGVQVAKCFPLRREAAREYAKAMKREKSRQTH